MPVPLLQQEIHSYFKGSSIEHTLTIKQNNKYKSPTLISVYLESPAAVQTGPFTPTKVGEGRYIYLQATTTSTTTGTWKIRWVGTGTAQGSTERMFYIQATSFT